ncbi:MAG: hypothetical protein P1V20_04535, partial [Verrucomicrobiales bacterium]|nr:hypothetical protein [Verrucomicrobiales bacterium]
KSDVKWLPDRDLFSLQSKFVSGNLTGGEREQILALNLSPDPVPFLRPASIAAIHTGRAGSTRKMFRSIPPLGKRSATYHIDGQSLTGSYPYHIDVRLISQMVPVNLIKRISSVGFDYNLSAAELARRVAFGHQVDSYGTRKGGAVTIWKECIKLDECDKVLQDFRPDESAVLHVPVAEYPFPHTSEEEIARRRKEAASAGKADFMIKHLGPYLPEVWPLIVPEGLPFLPGPDDPLVPVFSDSLFPDPTLFED